MTSPDIRYVTTDDGVRIAYTAIGAGLALEHVEVIKRYLPTEEESLVGSA